MKCPRRHALLKSYAAESAGDGELAMVWRSKQDDRPGTSLPLTFPCLAKLAAARYTTVEDVDGASLAELRMNAGLSRREGLAVLTALATL